MSIALNTVTPSTEPNTGWFQIIYTNLFVLIVLMEILILSVGEYTDAANATLGKDVSVLGIYQIVEQSPHSFSKCLWFPLQALEIPALSCPLVFVL